MANLATTFGLVLSIFGVIWGNPVMLVGALACDVVDGRLARALNEVTDFGGRLDWYTDTATAHLIAWKIGAPWLSIVLVVWHSFARGEDIHFSGRAALTVAYLWTMVVS